MIGVIGNAIAILAGGIYGLVSKQPIPASTQSALKVISGAATVWFGLQLCWNSFSGPFSIRLKQFLIVLLSLILGRLLGKGMRFQKWSNTLGHIAKKRMDNPRKEDGLLVCAILFCIPPLGLVGAVVDGLQRYTYPLLIKAVMDGLAMTAFSRMFGASALLCVLPVLAVEGGLALLAQQCLPILRAEGLLNVFNCTAGFIIFSVALVILELKKVELANYLPALALAPIFTYLAR